MAEPAAAVQRAPTARTWRLAIGGFIVIGGVVAVLERSYQAFVAGNPIVEQALLGGLIAALATTLGTLPALLRAGTSERARDAMLGFSSGVMLGACSFSLIVPALQAAQAQGAGRMEASLTVAVALACGAALLLFMERKVQVRLDRRLALDLYADRDRMAWDRRRASVWLFVFAVMLHNVPEGLAIGVGFAGDDPQSGRALATGIAIQDVPEGLVIAMALRGVGYRPAMAILLGAISGLSEPLAAVLGAVVVGASTVLLPWGLGLAAGAMLFVIGHTLIPELHRGGRPVMATTSMIGGFILMMVLDTALG